MTLEFYSGVIFVFSKGIIDKKCVFWYNDVINK